jgi:hypothetical protein
MDFSTTLTKVVTAFDAHDISYALIGGLAIALRGVQRSTLDADFILLAENLKTCDSILFDLGYELEFRSENVSHYMSSDVSMGRLDFLHAFRPATLGMLERAERIELTSQCSIPVVHTEDLIGLKIQAAVNDSDREIGDWNDIYLLIDHTAREGNELDWELISDYLKAFNLEFRLEELKERHAKIKSR